MRPLFRAFSQRVSTRTRSSKYTRTDSRGGAGGSGLRTSSSERIVGDKADEVGREPRVSFFASECGGGAFDVSGLTAEKVVSIAMPELPKRESPWKV